LSSNVSPLLILLKKNSLGEKYSKTLEQRMEMNEIMEERERELEIK
jgi:hypothetical protein